MLSIASLRSVGTPHHRTVECRPPEEAAGRTGLARRLAIAMTLASVPSFAALPVQGGEIQVDVTDDRLSLQAEDVAVAEVLQAIGEAASFEVVIRGDLGMVGRRSLEEEPLAAGLRRLAGENSILMLYEKDASGEQQLREIRVQAAGTTTAAVDPAGQGDGRRKRSGRAPGGDIQSYQQLATLDNARRVDAVRGLARRKDEAAASVLAEALVRDGNVAVRRLAANALSSGEAGEVALDALKAALGDAERSIRIQAMRGLTVNLGNGSASLLVDVVQNDGDPAVRRAAVQLVSAMDGDEAQQVLEAALDDDDDTVRRIAEAALNR